MGVDDSVIPALNSGCLIRKQFSMQPEAVLLKATASASDYYSARDGMEYNWKKVTHGGINNSLSEKL